MPSDGIFNDTIFMLERSLDLRSLQHRVLSSNIANLDTPNYKAFELVVEEEINRERELPRNIRLVRTHSNHFPIKATPMDNVKLKAADPPEFSLRGDGNTVNVDRTMGKLAENTILYKTAAQLISKKLTGLKNAIKGGK
jgi:flagellar basal-body rod protein FlgB